MNHSLLNEASSQVQNLETAVEVREWKLAEIGEICSELITALEFNSQLEPGEVTVMETEEPEGAFQPGFPNLTRKEVKEGGLWLCVSFTNDATNFVQCRM